MSLFSNAGSEPTKALDAVAATTTSAAINVSGAKKIMLALTRTNHSSGNTVYTVTVSLNGVDFYAYNKLISNVANTNAQTPIRVASVTSSSNETVLLTLDPMDCFVAIKVVATITTDGKATAWVLAEY